MSAKTFIISHNADKDIEKLPLRIQNKIDKAFTRLKTNPISGLKLHGELADYYKFRVGDYRIIYSFNKERSVVIVVKIEHRQGVYK